MTGILIIHFFALIVPGPDFLLVSRTGLSGHKAAIYKVAAGVTFGVMIWAIISLLGLHVILNYYPILNSLISIAGALYLLYLACVIYQQAFIPLEEAQLNSGNYFLNGLLTNLSNPKAIIYFSSIFSLFSISSDLIYPVLLLILLETIVWFLFLGFVFSYGKAKEFYRKNKGKIDITTSAVFGFFSLSLLLKTIL